MCPRRGRQRPLDQGRPLTAADPRPAAAAERGPTDAHPDRPRLAVVDYGMGNLASVAKALERAGGDVRLTQSSRLVEGADAVVLPGVGAFRDAAARLERSGLGAAITRRIAAGVPFLGVCLGMQLLFESSAEGGHWQGLGVLGGTVERLETPLKVPHIGWNQLEWRAAGVGMAHGLPTPAAVYFVHSYAARPADASVVAATADYGGDLCAAVARERLWAVQFHPEKSSSTGLGLLANFIAVVREAA